VVKCILEGVVLRVVFRVFIFGCSAYIRRLLFVFPISSVSVCLEQGLSCLIKFIVSKKKSSNHLMSCHNFILIYLKIKLNFELILPIGHR